MKHEEKERETAWNDRMRLQREKEGGEGSKEVSDLLTVYIRESGSSRYFTRVSEVAKQTPPTLSLPHSVLPILPPLFNLLSSFQAPLHLHALYIHAASIAATAVLGCCMLFTPLREALLSFDGESERSHVSWRLPRRLTGTPNRNFNAYACTCISCI